MTLPLLGTLHFAMTYDGRIVLTQLVRVINPSARELSCLAARLPLPGFKPEGYSSNSQLTHTLTSRALLGIVLRIRTAGARRIALARAYQRLLRALPVTPMV